MDLCTARAYARNPTSFCPFPSRGIPRVRTLFPQYATSPFGCSRTGCHPVTAPRIVEIEEVVAFKFCVRPIALQVRVLAASGRPCSHAMLCNPIHVPLSSLFSNGAGPSTSGAQSGSSNPMPTRTELLILAAGLLRGYTVTDVSTCF
jgi:hypothetical protein